MKFFRLTCLLAVIFALDAPLKAQNQPQTPEQQEKQMMEFIDKEVKRLTELLDLEYWQEFYVDSTLTHDYHAMTEEMMKLQVAKVENSDLYINVQDKWMEQIDATYKRIFNEAQWKKYWKTGAERAKKARDKRKK
ncbi:MAG: hypothetical protein II841_03490 [Bacteroidales bacterium]|nr:hypothetical protein [Bacteroidales bacterium]